MSTQVLRYLLIMVFVLPGLTACGGGGGDTSAAAGGTGGTGVSFGTVTDFGSIIVNNSRIDDSTASVTLDDVQGTGERRGLKQGMVVRVDGTFSGNTGTASTIEFRDNLEGPVCDLASPIVPPINEIITLRVLGQTVIVDATTIVDNSLTINPGNIVEVSGLPDALEQIHASFIEKKSVDTAVIEVKGQIDTLSVSTFTINDLIVDFSGATIDNSIPNGVLAAGQFVEVKGTNFACNDPDNQTDSLIATSVELEPEGAGNIPAGFRAEVEGFVTTALNPPGGPGVFTIGNQEVVTTGSTRFLPEDFTAFDLVVGAKVEAEGTFANGVLTATKISFRQNVRLESDIDSTNGNTFTLVGLPGIIITRNSATEVDDNVNIVQGEHVRVRGIEGPNNTVLATRIDDRSGSNDAFLQGTVDTNVNGIVTVLGVQVDTGGIFQFEDVNDNPISPQQFLDLAQLGTLVKFKGELQGSTISYDEAELED